jgi:hypothetical protein
VEGVFTSRPALELLWGYDDPLLSLLNALLPPGTLADGAKVRGCVGGASGPSVRKCVRARWW